MSSQRLFFALWPDAPARAALRTLANDVAARREGRAPREDNLHVTLAFLGDVNAGRIARLEPIGATCASACAPFLLTLDALGGASRGIAWLAPRRVPPSLAALHAALTGALEREDFPVERRRYRPHVTLARQCTLPVRRHAVAPVVWRVERLSLVASRPSPQGPVYSDIATWPLCEAGGTTMPR